MGDMNGQESLVDRHLIPESPVWKNDRLNEFLGVDLIVKRDDLFPYAYGGNKARKTLYIMKEAERSGADAIVTTGGLQSNHTRAVALACAERQWHCSVLFHTEEEKITSTGNNLLVKLSGADIKIIHLKDAGKEMDLEMERLRRNGLHPFYVFGGGHSTTGTFAFYDAVAELCRQITSDGYHPNYLIVPLGTGTTHAGLHCGCEHHLPDTQVIGISIGRPKDRALDVAERCVQDFRAACQPPRLTINPLTIYDDWAGDGYESVSPELIGLITHISRNFGLTLDPTYSGKAFLGLTKLIKDHRIKRGSKVIFWHTGGLLNLLSSPSFNSLNLLSS